MTISHQEMNASRQIKMAKLTLQEISVPQDFQISSLTRNTLEKFMIDALDDEVQSKQSSRVANCFGFW